MELIKKLSRKFKAAIDFKGKKKKAKWEEFKKNNSARISYLPKNNGRIVVPAMWNKHIEEWVWITRSQRRMASKIISKRNVSTNND